MKRLLLLFLLLSYFKFKLYLSLVLILGLPTHQLFILNRRTRIAYPVFVIADLHDSGHAPFAPFTFFAIKFVLVHFIVFLICELLFRLFQVIARVRTFFIWVAEDLLDRAGRGLFHVHFGPRLLLNLVRIVVLHSDYLREEQRLLLVVRIAMRISFLLLSLSFFFVFVSRVRHQTLHYLVDLCEIFRLRAAPQPVARDLLSAQAVHELLLAGTAVAAD